MENDQQEQEPFIPEEGEESEEQSSEEATHEPKEVDWKATAMRYKNKLEKQKPKSSTKEDTSEVRSMLARLELKTDGYSEDAINFIQRNGGREALKDPHVKAAIDLIQEQKRAENSVITNETSKSDIERKFTNEELNAMSAEELDKILPKARK